MDQKLSNLDKSPQKGPNLEEFVDQEHVVDYDARIQETFSDSGLLASPLLQQDKIHDSTSSTGHEATTSTTNEAKPEEERKSEADTEEEVLKRSVFVKNVDYSSTVEEIKHHFKECGTITRVTICKDKVTRRPNGNCYIEFTKQESALRSKILNESLFKGRQITVQPKRKNLPFKGKVQSQIKAKQRAEKQQMYMMNQIIAKACIGNPLLGGFGVAPFGGMMPRGGFGAGSRGRGGFHGGRGARGGRGAPRLS